ncbi:hypothetical protein CEXT_347631 [Caerostris extrusa]|uniref:Uncharacterized protein n=1 Tax=Caerostris extrusa TaxID=172846 RepID=A0AAV4S333_CAEEX|nr:hypothetical protein CEXT_347631 [Caerostris extrusa]
MSVSMQRIVTFEEKEDGLKKNLKSRMQIVFRENDEWDENRENAPGGSSLIPRGHYLQCPFHCTSCPLW